MPDSVKGMTRRTFLKRAGMAATAVGVAGLLPAFSPARAARSAGGRPGLNMLVIMVDEMRSPSMYLPRRIRKAYLPNLTKLADEGVSFTNHHIAHLARPQLSSHVDLVPLLLTLASGSERWREAPQYEHLATRLSLAKILTNPLAPGRPYIAHACDEPPLFDSLSPLLPLLPPEIDPPVLDPAPDHLMGVCTPGGKFAQYAYWQPRTTHPVRQDMESEAYDYRTESGRLELHNSCGSNLPADIEVVKKGQRTLEHAIEHELEAPLLSFVVRN